MKIASVAGAALAAGLMASQVNADYIIESDGNRLALPSQESVIVCTNSGTLKVNRPVAVEFLLLGGGGGGGSSYGMSSAGGGGGAGGFVHVERAVLSPGTYEFTIGAGGVENVKGGDSSFDGHIAYGGGPGASGDGYGPDDQSVAYDGASGGGANGISTWNRLAGAGIEGQGHNGGLNLFGAVYYTGLVTSELRRGDGSTPNTAGGGGGAGAPGGSGTIDFENVEIRDDGYTYVNDDYTAGAGGDGLPCSITGEEVYYAGGGGGGQYGWYRENRSAPGGKGGGGAGGLYQDFAHDGDETHGWMQDGAAGADGLGGGGGGGGTSGNGRGSHGGPGGCGALIIRYAEHFKPGSMNGKGGMVTNYVDAAGVKWYVHTFTESGTFELPNNALCDVLVVGGGGGGGNGSVGPGGGGGAGGFIYREGVGIFGGTYTVTVGAGGEPNKKGGDSVFSGFNAYGGGAGKHDYNEGDCDGGSGGGGCGISNWRCAGGTGVVGQGYDGGSNTWMTMFGPTAEVNIPIKNWSGDDANSAGGGGGAGAPGGSSTYVAEETKEDNGETKSFSSHYYAGDGGDGLPCSITGEEVWYAGGGGGGEFGWYRADYQSSGGKGGGGKGGYCQDPDLIPGEDGVAGLGGGGGGGGRGNGTTLGGKGGSGIVIIRYKKYNPGMIVVLR